MALEEYRRKRDFKKTPEPAGRVARRRAAALGFVIQKHAARRLHYDFRLELDGVLKSWAVPKGPSLDPGEKRLAVHVEDHPIEYGGFEGVIPEGQYGGGTVMLWDRGTWTPLNHDPAAAYAEGHLKFRLDGEKLHGSWALVRMGGRAAGERHENWLLIKERDEEAVPGSDSAVVETLTGSVASGRDMATIAADRDRIWDGTAGEITPDPPPKKRTKAKAKATPRAARLPSSIAPMLATLVEGAPEGGDWLNEIKLDGYRLLARLEGGKARLLTRSGLDWTTKFPEIAAAVEALEADGVVLDGEAVALDAKGRSDFSLLQQALSEGRTAGLVYYVFDLLFSGGRDLRKETLVDRKAQLAALLEGAGPRLRYADHQQGNGPAFLAAACAAGLEGIVAKRADAPYAGARSRTWLKVKCGRRQEFVVLGWTDPAGSRQGFGALLLGLRDDKGALVYAGRVGTGFDTDRLRDVRRTLDAAARKTATVKLPKGVSAKGVHWVEPRLVAEVRYSEMTRDGIVRHAVFLGLREDKPASEVIMETPAPAAESTGPRPGRSAGRVTIRDVSLSHPERVLYAEQAITKLDLARYWDAVADHALPHLAGRALALVRCPEGKDAACFFQKHPSRGMPKAIRTAEIAPGEGTGTKSETGLWIEDAAGLVALAQMGALEVHPWGSLLDDLERPDRLVLDLDPEEGLPWERMIEAALLLRKRLKAIGLESFPKTTGGKGFHVVVPIVPELAWPEAKAFCRALAGSVVAAEPERYTANLMKRARKGRIFIDYLRNGRGATAIGAFSTRARQGAPVSAPVTWAEVESGLRSDAFTIATLPARLAKLKRDPWQGFFETRQRITKKALAAVGL